MIWKLQPMLTSRSRSQAFFLFVLGMPFWKKTYFSHFLTFLVNNLSIFVIFGNACPISVNICQRTVLCMYLQRLQVVCTDKFVTHHVFGDLICLGLGPI